MAEKKQSAPDATPKAPAPARKKKLNAYDEPFGNEITANYSENRSESVKPEEKPPVVKSPKNESDPSEDHTTPAPKKPASSTGTKKAPVKVLFIERLKSCFAEGRKDYSSSNAPV
jgi:hypothetical protein